MSKEIDARGLSCPQPLILTKKEIDAGKPDILILADDPCARDNVRSMAERNGYQVEISDQGDEFKIVLKKA